MIEIFWILAIIYLLLKGAYLFIKHFDAVAKTIEEEEKLARNNDDKS